MFSEEKLSQAGQTYWYKIFLLKRLVRFGISKNCISKLFIKMFTEKAVKPSAYRMLLNYKTSVTSKKCFNFTPGNCVWCEPAFAGHNSIFCRTLSDVCC